MKPCNEIKARMAELSGAEDAAWPPGLRAHRDGCVACRRAVATARLVRGLVAAAARGPEPSPGFAERVLAATARAPRTGPADLWRPAWGLLPAFAGAVAAILVLFLQAAPPSDAVWPGLPGGLTASERLILGTAPPDGDHILAALVE